LAGKSVPCTARSVTTALDGLADYVAGLQLEDQRLVGLEAAQGHLSSESGFAYQRRKSRSG
jgi:hypothetical protein